MFGSFVIAGNKKVYAEAIAKLMIFQVFFFFFWILTTPIPDQLLGPWFNPDLRLLSLWVSKNMLGGLATLFLCVCMLHCDGLESPVFMGIYSRSTVLLTRIKRLMNTNVFSYTVIFLLLDGCVFVFTFPAFKSTEKQTSELANKERTERFFNGKTAFV